MSNIKRKFVVTISSVETEVFPLNGNDLEYKFKTIKDTINFEKTLETRLIFGNNSKTGIYDYNFFYGYESNSATKCQEIQITIYRRCNNTWVEEFIGVVALNEGQWDLDRCTVSHTVKNYTSTYDKIKNYKTDTLNPLSYFCYFGEYTESMGTPVGTDDHTYLYTFISGSPVFICIERLISSAGYIAPRGHSSGFGSQYPYLLFGTFCRELVGQMFGQIGHTYGDEQLHSDFFDWNAIGDTPGYVSSGTPPIPPSAVVPNSLNTAAGRKDMYIAYDRGINYVTGQPNKLTHLIIAPKSNINNISASQWEEDFAIVLNPTTGLLEGFANSNKITFADLEKFWATTFNAYWFIDTDGSMRVEHISWFINNSHLYDSTSPTNMKYNIAKRKYEYDKNDLPNTESFKFSQNRDILNGGIIDPYSNKNNEIFYDSICVNNEDGVNIKEYELPKFVTDIGAIHSDVIRPGIYDKKGGFMSQVYFSALSATYAGSGVGGGPLLLAWTRATIENDSLTLSASPSNYENGHIQWANLIRRYLKDNRILSVGKNGTDTINFTSRVVKSKKQKDIIIENCCEDEEFIPELALVRTELGDGSIEEAVYSTKNNTIKMIIRHD